MSNNYSIVPFVSEKIANIMNHVLQGHAVSFQGFLRILYDESVSFELNCHWEGSNNESKSVSRELIDFYWSRISSVWISNFTVFLRVDAILNTSCSTVKDLSIGLIFLILINWSSNFLPITKVLEIENVLT